MRRGGFNIELIADTSCRHIYITGMTDHDLTMRIDLRIQIDLAIQNLSRIFRVTRCAQQGRGAGARGQRFGESGHWKLLIGRHRTCRG